MLQVVAENDITHGLPSLQFQSNLNESELSLLPLRKRSFELLLHAAAQTTYLVGMLNSITHFVSTAEVLRPGTTSKHRVSVGFIGGGRLARHIISTLLHHVTCLPQDVTVSTFQPDKLDDLVKVGVTVCSNNNVVIEQCDVVVVCIPASQYLVLQRDVTLRSHHFLITHVSTLSKDEVVSTLRHRNVIKTEYLYNKDAGYLHSEPYQTVALTLEDEEVVERLFPVIQPGYVYTTPDWLRDAILAFYRYILKICPDGAADTLNYILFGKNKDRYLVPRDLRIISGAPGMDSEAEQLNNLTDLGGKMVHLSASVTHRESLAVLFEGFKSFFRAKHVDVSHYK